MNVNQALNEALKVVPKSVAAGVVDMESGVMLGIKTTESHPQEVFNFLAAATKGMNEGRNVTDSEAVFKKTRGIKTDERYFQEMIMTSGNLLHFFTRLPGQQGIAFAVVATKDANVGLVLVKGREVSKSIEI